MQIDDLTAGLSLSFLIHLNTEQLQFESKILEVYPRRHTLLAEGVFTDEEEGKQFVKAAALGKDGGFFMFFSGFYQSIQADRRI